MFRQSNTAVDTVAWAGSGSGAFTVVTAKVKPNSSGGTVALLSRVANPNNFYYVGLRANRLEIGRRSWGTITSLKSTPFTAVAGNWYTLSLNLFFTGTITGSVTPVAGGYGATVSAPDPGATYNFGSAVGFWTANASASFDNITLADDRVTPPSSAPPSSAAPSSGASPSAAACPATLEYVIAARWPSGFQAQLTLRNISTTTIPAGWVLTFRFINGEAITNVFSVNSWSQVGTLVTIVGPVWGPIAPGSSLMFGFLAGSPNGPGDAVTDVTFNGIRC